MWKKAIEFSKSIWHRLPVKVQGAIVVSVAAAGTSLARALTDPTGGCLAVSCLKHHIGSAVAAGVIAGRAFFMRPGPGPKVSPIEISESGS